MFESLPIITEEDKNNGYVKITSFVNEDSVLKSLNLYYMKKDEKNDIWIPLSQLASFQHILKSSHSNFPSVNYVYIVTSKCYNAVKIGRWSGKLTNLWSRYQTLLTSDMVIILGRVKNAKKVEENMLCKFDDMNISSEVFMKYYLSKYVYYLYKVSRGDISVHNSRFSLSIL
jgi:hypothetical protein